MDTEANVKVKYVGFTRRTVAAALDQIIFFFPLLIVAFISLGKDDFLQVFEQPATETSVEAFFGTAIILILYIALEIRMITRFGGTPGKLLCGIYIKDANTLKNVTLMQAVIRSTIKVFLWIPSCVSNWFSILPILVLIFVIFDQRKQAFYDKIAKTVVTDHKPEKHYSSLNYVGITRRAVAYIIDLFIIVGISLVFFSPAKMTFDPVRFILSMCSFFLLPIVFGIFMVRRFSGTPGQLLCCICIKDANTLENITLAQATIRYVLFKVPSLFLLSFIVIVGIIGESLDNPYEWWFLLTANLVFITIIIAIILIFICAIFDQRSICSGERFKRQ